MQSEADMGFVYACVAAQAITADDTARWATEVIADNGTIPSEAIINLSELKESSLVAFYRAAGGKVLSSNAFPKTLGNKDALYAVAFQRKGDDVFDPTVSKKTALRLWKKNPRIREKFSSVFPWITLDAE